MLDGCRIRATSIRRRVALSVAKIERGVAVRAARWHHGADRAAVPPADVVAVYGDDVDDLQRLLRTIPHDWTVRLWAAGDPHPALDELTVGRGTANGVHPLVNLLDTLEADRERWLVAIGGPVIVQGGLARFVATADEAELDLVMPAHRRVSLHRLVPLRHRVGAIARRTSYVEWATPVCAVRPDWRDRVIEVVTTPPQVAVNLELSRLAAEGLRLGVIDRTPMVAMTWPKESSPDEVAELERRLDEYGVVGPTTNQRLDAVLWTAGTWWRLGRVPWRYRPRRRVRRP